MKNRILAIAATAGLGLAAATSNAQEIETTITVGTETEYVFRGVQLADDSLQAAVDFSYRDAYFGIWTNQPYRKSSFDNEVDFYAGYAHRLNDKLTLDVGGTFYLYPEGPDTHTTEFYLGLSADTVLAPKVYAYYDIDLDAFAFEGAVSKSFPINENLAFEVSAAYGWVKPESEDNVDRISYFYYTAGADFVYTINDTYKASFGGRLGGNDEGLNLAGSTRDDRSWLGLSFTGSF